MADEQEQPSRLREAALGGVTTALRGVSTALMQGAFESFGHAFSDTGDVKRDAASEESRMAPWRQAGQKAAGALDQRWQKMEYDDLQKTKVQDFIEGSSENMEEFRTLNALLDEGQWQGPDGKTTQYDINKLEDRAKLNRYRSQLFTRFYSQQSDMKMSLMNEGAKYPNNQMIQDQLMNVFTETSNQLTNTAQPRERVETEKAYSDIEVQERNAAANERQARTQASRADKESRPKSYAEALADPNIGLRGIHQWGEQNMLAGPDGEAYRQEILSIATDQLQTRHAKEQVKAGEIKTVADYDRTSLDTDNTEHIESQLAQMGGQLQRGAEALMFKAKHPAEYKTAKAYSPQYYELVEGAKGPDSPKGIVEDRRITTEQRDDNVRAWKKPLADKLEEYMSDPKNDPDIEVAIDYIIDEWLPGAITGSAESTAPEDIKATQSTSTNQYRELVARYARKYLENNFHKLSKVAADENKDAANKARRRRRQQGRSSPLGRTIVNAAGAIKSLFEEDVE